MDPKSEVFDRHVQPIRERGVLFAEFYLEAARLVGLRVQMPEHVPPVITRTVVLGTLPDVDANGADLLVVHLQDEASAPTSVTTRSILSNASATSRFPYLRHSFARKRQSLAIRCLAAARALGSSCIGESFQVTGLLGTVKIITLVVGWATVCVGVGPTELARGVELVV